MTSSVLGRRDPVSARLPVAVQTTVAALRERAAAHQGPVVDLAIGAPVDPTPAVVQRALAAEADSPGYPLTVGRRDLREAALGWLARCHDVHVLHQRQVLPTNGLKEVIASLALHLGLGPGDLVTYPRLAYPTYAVGAALVGAQTAHVDGLDDLLALDDAAEPPALVWVNSPSNPTGRVLAPEELRAMVTWCRERGALLVSDECYLDLGWETRPTSVLHADVCGGSTSGILALHSLSKRSNLAGYRIGFVSGDADVVAELVTVRRNLGLQMAGPQQGAAIAALDDDQHVTAQRSRYAARRTALRGALVSAGFRVEHSEAGLYLWATRGEACEDTVGWLADRGIVAVAGSEYGAAGAEHVRFALTVPDEAVGLAVERLAASGPAPVTPAAPASTEES
ncbi:MAG: succinyldiaminopimelate transaminase [Nocardioides sp.]|nr:succinyldiaminopimelate transaminase [Nocardioides sp.]